MPRIWLLCWTVVFSCSVLPAQADMRKITGIVVDAESRNQLDDVNIELQESGQAKQQLAFNANKPFTIEYNFKDDSDYTLVFTKADYYPQEVDLSSSLKSNKIPKQMTISLSGEDSAFVFWGKSLNRETSEPISNIRIITTNLMTGEQVTTTSDQEGGYQLNITSGYEYEVNVESPHHLKRFAQINYCKDSLDTSDKFCFSGFSDVSLNEQGGVSGASVLLDKIEIGKKFKVDNIYYDYNKASIKQSALSNLRKVLYILIDNPQITIELGSHADSRGSDSYNMLLSQRRADAAVDYIVKQGIGRDRITSKGYGETVLVNHCKNDVECSDQVHGENRRTEFIIVGIDETYFAKK